MSEPTKGKVILATFSGRRDRMELLCDYARAALDRGIIDEWHVWDFTRNTTDKAWLRQEFRTVRLTPNKGREYFEAGLSTELAEATQTITFSVSAISDTHLGLRRSSGQGDSYEIVLGGWDNQRSGVRAYHDAEALTDWSRRAPGDPMAVAVHTPNLFPEWGFTEVKVEISPSGLSVIVEGRRVVEWQAPIAPGCFDVLYRTSFGSNAEWSFPHWPDRGVFLFIPGKSHDKDNYYMPFYQHYARNVPKYKDDIFIKCDDDIVFMDLERLSEFVQFRRDNRQYFMISANVINNGICAYYQQQQGLIPTTLMQLELPSKGAGSLWESAAKAEALHRHFVADPQPFLAIKDVGIEFNRRISINFIAFFGEDFAMISDTMHDDEGWLCHQARWRTWKTNYLYFGFVVSHLTFGSQDSGCDIESIIKLYEGLEAKVLAPV